ncbi:hypothetical protein Nm8I071_58660 [Nonomuraea sp. TT08I-71]|nr:hypothetical protein Nm8I071_58660 [Nonomuraea sp. TT08I-71]
MPRKVTRGRAAPEGGVTAAMAGIGWVFGYGIVTPVFSARTGGASLRRIRLGRQGRHRGNSVVVCEGSCGLSPPLVREPTRR